MASKHKNRIMIVDDHAIFREGLKMILSETSDMIVSGEAGTSSEALKLTRENDFDMVLLDISMPDRDGIETLALLKKEHPKLKVLMLSMHRETKYAVRAIRTGAAGYLNKQSAPSQLVTAMRQVAAGKKYISPEVAHELACLVSGESEALPHESLSNREYQTLCLIASGKTVSAIAAELCLSVKTVSMYRSRLLEKMQLKNNAELTHYAIKHGLV